jgi:hypothetical protein
VNGHPLVPYRTVSIRTTRTEPEVAQLIASLLHGPDSWLTLWPQAVPGHRLVGTVIERRVRLVVLPKPWHRTAYLPVGIGVLTRVGDGTLLNVSFRPSLVELLVLGAWVAIVVGSGGTLWFLAFPFIYHLIGCETGFGPEVDRVVALLKATLDASPTARENDSAPAAADRF